MTAQSSGWSSSMEPVIASSSLKSKLYGVKK